MAYYPKPTPPNRSTRKTLPLVKARPAVKKFPSKEDASGRMSQPKPSRRRIKPFKPGNKGGMGAAVPRPAKYIGPEPRRTRPTAGGTPKAKKMVPAVKRKRNAGYNK